MPTNTGNLGLTEPSGSDVVSELRLAIAANAVALGNADIYATGTISARPAAAAGNTGMVYWATDAAYWSVSNGSAWTELQPALTPFAVASGNPTAFPNQLVQPYGGGQLVGTPGGPAFGCVFGVQPLNSGTTVIANSGTFAGGGANGTTSFPVAQNSVVMFLWDGARWAVLAGQQDTGWVALTLGGGSPGTLGTTPAAKLVGNRVHMRGAASYSSYSFPLATLPGSIPPPLSGADIFLAAWQSSYYYGASAPYTNVPVGVTINSSGQFGLTSNYPSELLFDNIAYDTN